MDNLSLREKLDALEACEKLIQYYEDDYKTAAKIERQYWDDELAGPDYTSIPKDKLDYYRKLRRDLVASLEMDPLLNQISKSRMI